jgi:hypothetical protein
MAIDVTLTLGDLHCVRESEGGSEPYIWPILLWIDDDTLMTPELVGVRGPVLGDARVVLKESMNAGETATIPFPLGSLGTRFEDVSASRYVLLVVALFEKDETPDTAMWAGCKAFAAELRAAVADNLLAIRQAITDGDDAALQDIIDVIKARVKQRTESTTWDALTGWQKTRVVIGTLNLDDFVGADFYFSEPDPADFELSLRTESASEEYRLTATMDVDKPTVDLCQGEVDGVKAAQDVVDGIEGMLAAAKTELQNAPPSQKAAIVARITRLNDDLTVAMAALEEARNALQRCRDRWKVVGEGRPGDVGGVLGP